MEKVSTDDAEPVAIEADSDRLGLSAPLGATDVAVNRYRLAPGDGLPGGLHAHVDQEEIFVVLEGQATFETLGPVRDADRPEWSADRSVPRSGREVVVYEGEAIRFAPGEFQSGRNDSDAHLVMLAIGAPRDSEDVRIPQACPECDYGNLQLDADESGLTLVCPDCGAERVPRPCPECGHEDLRVALSDDEGTVVVCRGCGSEFEEAPLWE